jgi:hypothetical protein
VGRRLPSFESEGRHEEVIAGAADRLKEIFDKSRRSVYPYLDDLQKKCNQAFASLLGYRSPKEWSDVWETFPEAFVAAKSPQTLISAYQVAITNFLGSTIDVTWKRKDGKEVSTTTILVPIAFDGHTMALHFISRAWEDRAEAPSLSPKPGPAATLEHASLNI